MSIYVIELLLVVGSALLVDFRNDKQRKNYIIFCAVILGIILFLRAPHIGSDLGRYKFHFQNCGRNTFAYLLTEYSGNRGYYLYNFLAYRLFGGNFKLYLMLTSVLTFLPPMWLIKTYSKNAYLSFLSYICMGFYIFQFSGLKQALALSILCLAFHFAIQRSPWKFYLLLLVAMSIHFPSIIFAPIYLIASRGFKKSDVVFDAAIGLVIWLFRDQIVKMMAEGYDSVIEEEVRSGVGGKVAIIVAIVLFAMLVKGVDEKDRFYGTLLHCMFISAIIQFFASYGNVFERLADYYFFYIVLFLPCVLPAVNTLEVETGGRRFQKLLKGENSWYKLAITLAMILFWFMYSAKTPGTFPYRTWL